MNKQELVYNRVMKFMVDNGVTCEEAIFQCDKVIENAYSLLSDLFNIVEDELPIEDM